MKKILTTKRLSKQLDDPNELNSLVAEVEEDERLNKLKPPLFNFMPDKEIIQRLILRATQRKDDKKKSLS
jgi:hypothetical protein